MSTEEWSESHSPISAEVFLDTSIHCSRHKGSLFTDRIDAVLRAFQWRASSTYTKVEYGNVVLAKAVYFLSVLNKFNSLEKARSHVANVLNDQWHRGHRTWAFNLLDAFGENDTVRTERAKRLLRAMLKQGVAFVDATCDAPLANGTDCYWAKKGVQELRDGTLTWKTPQCSREHKRCTLDEFFEKNRTTYQAIKTAIDALSVEELTDQLRSFSEIIGRATEDPTILLDYRNGCRLLADATIAVDSSSCKNMFSQNIKESIVLTRVLDQTFYYLPPNADNPMTISRSGSDSEQTEPLAPGEAAQ